MSTARSVQSKPLTYWAGKTLIGIKWVSLVNILLNRMAVQEYLQDVSVGSLAMGIKEMKSDGLDVELNFQFSNMQKKDFLLK